MRLLLDTHALLGWLLDDSRLSAAARAAGVRTLPWRHRDPLDRLLVTQSKVEGLTLVTGGSALGLYGVDLLR